MKKINLGAGATKIEGVETHDIDPKFGCDHGFDLRFAPWPLPDDTYDRVYLFHTIEHIEKPFHKNIYQEIQRILAPNGIFIMSYPEFEIVAQNWIDNKNLDRKFWEATIFGLQRTNSDYHLCAMDCEEVRDNFLKYGYKNVAFRSEIRDTFNTVVCGTKGELPKTYEHLVYEEVIKERT